MTKLCFEDNVPLKNYTTYRIGGPARKFCQIDSIEEMRELLSTLSAKGERYLVIGKGSNCLFDDRGFDGVVILNKISFIRWQEEKVFVGAGYSFSLLGTQTARSGLSGLEFAAGIPGSVGGAIFMNAGANKKEVKDVVTKVEFVTDKGELVSLTREEMSFSYRTSPFQTMKGAIVSGEFSLTRNPSAKESQRGLLEYRKATQPYKAFSCGCVFRNPEGTAAGKVIEECGLKGLSEGGALVSDVHANFIVNHTGEASSKNILDLIGRVQEIALEKKGIRLEAEVRYIPYQEEDV